MNVNILPLNERFVLPSYGAEGSAGLDVTATDKIIVEDKGTTYISYKLGFAVIIPKGFMGLLFPRSSISKYDLDMANSVGVIDYGYLGEVEVRMIPIKNKSNFYKKGDKVAQLIIVPVPTIELNIIDSLDKEYDRGGGFGSTDERKKFNDTLSKIEDDYRKKWINRMTTGFIDFKNNGKLLK